MPSSSNRRALPSGDRLLGSRQDDCEAIAKRATRNGLGCKPVLVGVGGNTPQDVAVEPKDIDIHDSYAGSYGYVRPAKMEAVRLLAETEGTDPRSRLHRLGHGLPD
jgi:hypothetical protein